MEQNSQSICIGIDLGTTNSEVACVHQGKPVVIRIDNSKIMPSVISLDEKNQILIGKATVNNELASPANTIRWIKRKMGREELIPLGNQMYTPQMISSLILSRLKHAAEEFLGCSVHQAVITVPAFFNEKQREATKEAAELAGLEPLRLLNEPTAAALAYAFNSKKNERCLVYDLGGGTFDVSIVDFSQDIMEVRSSHGDTELGGTDFDKLIAEQVRQFFLKENNIDLALNPISWARLLRAAEAAKIRLSTEASATILEEFIATSDNKPLHLNFSVSRTEFENMISPIIHRSITSVRKTLEMASLSPEDLNRVILVGGSTYIPLAVSLLEEELKITPQAWINPSTVVAMGAAIEAAKLVGQSIGPIMVDITPHSLGIECLNEHDELFNCTLIRRNTPIPAMASNIFFKTFPEQEAIKIQVYQGESKNIHLNKFLGSFRLEGLTNNPTREVHVKFELNRSGLLHVTATEPASGIKAHHILKRAANSRIQHADLASLESVRIIQDELIEDGAEVDSSDENDIWLELEDSTEPNEIEEEGAAAKDPAELLNKVKILLESGTLADNDLNELNNELALTLAGDATALERLSNLVYYLD